MELLSLSSAVPPGSIKARGFQRFNTQTAKVGCLMKTNKCSFDGPGVDASHSEKMFHSSNIAAPHHHTLHANAGAGMWIGAVLKGINIGPLLLLKTGPSQPFCGFICLCVCVFCLGGMYVYFAIFCDRLLLGFNRPYLDFMVNSFHQRGYVYVVSIYKMQIL